MPGRSYTYADDSSYTEPGLRPWPPPATHHDDTLSGSPPLQIAWRGSAQLAIVFLATDTGNATPWTPGYVIPSTLKCRVYSATQPFKEIPVDMLNAGERYGYLDDQDNTPGPDGCYTASDLERLLTNSNILTLGADFGDSGDWLRAVSGMSGAGVEVLDEGAGDDQPGHLVEAHVSTSDLLAQSCFEVVQAYAEVRHAHIIDVAWATDNTGSMGSRQDFMKDAAVGTTQRLLDAGYNAWVAYTTFADWPPSDQRKNIPRPGETTDWGDVGDDPYNIRFPFGPLTPERQAQFATETYDGQGGNDTPEAGLEALCRMYVARAQILNGLHYDSGVRFDPISERSGRMLTGR